jgi:hypothetical protein
MPAYDSLNTQITAVKAEITSSLAASTYTAADLVYVAKALETLGNLLGINDLVQATADAQDQLTTYVSSVLNGSYNAVINKIYVGTGAEVFETYAGLQEPVAVFNADSTGYSQIAFQNKGTGSASSTDIIAYSDNGVDATGYIDMGITSSNFSDPNYTITGPNDGYIFMVSPEKFTASAVSKAITSNIATIGTSDDHGFRAGMPVVITGVDGVFNGTYTILATPTTTSFTYAKINSNVGSSAVSPAGTAVAGVTGNGNLILATSDTGIQNKIIFAAGGLSDNNTQMTIDPDLAVYIAIPTQSTSTATGALVVNGGLGLTGNLNVGGNVNITGTISFTGGGTTVQTANIAVVNPAIFVADTNAANLLDFTFAGGYTASGQKYAAFTKKASDGIWNLVSGLTVKPGNTVDYTNAVYDTLKVGKLLVTTTTPTASGEVTSKSYVDGQRADLELAILMGALA